ncbi:MAG: DUF488 domain-containing protein, partial [Acidobacteriota bacterium]
MGISTKRIYEEPSRSDGFRVLVDRLWPRGLKKADARLDAWIKEIPPSDALRRWFGHDSARWGEFQQRYFAELDGIPDVRQGVLERARNGPVTLLYGARDPNHNNGVALKCYL